MRDESHSRRLRHAGPNSDTIPSCWSVLPTCATAIAGACLVGWVVLLIGTNVLVGSIGSDFSQTFNLPSTDSQKAFDLLDNNFPARSGETAMRSSRPSPPWRILQRKRRSTR